MQLDLTSNRGPFLVSLAVAAAGCLLLAIYIREFQHEASGGEPIMLLALRKDVPAGVPLQEQMLIAHQVPETYVEARQVLASDKGLVLGVRTAIELQANQTLAWTDLVSTPRERASLSKRIPQGMRAMSIEQPRRLGLTDLLRPGDRVDVLLTRSDSTFDGRTVTLYLLQNILVLAVGKELDPLYSESAAARGDLITLLLSVDQASLLAHAQQSGQLSLTLRNEHDLEVNQGLPKTDDSDVLVESNRERRQRRLAIEKVD